MVNMTFPALQKWIFQTFSSSVVHIFNEYRSRPANTVICTGDLKKKKHVRYLIKESNFKIEISNITDRTNLWPSLINIIKQYIKEEKTDRQKWE